MFIENINKKIEFETIEILEQKISKNVEIITKDLILEKEKQNIEKQKINEKEEKFYNYVNENKTVEKINLLYHNEYSLENKKRVDYIYDNVLEYKCGKDIFGPQKWFNIHKNKTLYYAFKNNSINPKYIDYTNINDIPKEEINDFLNSLDKISEFIKIPSSLHLRKSYFHSTTNNFCERFIETFGPTYGFNLNDIKNNYEKCYPNIREAAQRIHMILLNTNKKVTRHTFTNIIRYIDEIRNII